MLTNLTATLAPLAQSHAIHLVSGSIAAGLLLLILPGELLVSTLFLLQRGMILLLLWPQLPAPLLASSALSSLAIGIIYSATTLDLYLHRRTSPNTRSMLLTHLPFRVATAALALLVAAAVARALPRTAIPELVTWMVVWLLIQSVFSLLLAPNPMQTGIGVLAFADAGRIVYSLFRPDPLLWGAWTVCDVLIALAVARLCISNAKVDVSVPPVTASPPSVATVDQLPDLADQQEEPTALEGKAE